MDHDDSFRPLKDCLNDAASESTKLSGDSTDIGYTIPNLSEIDTAVVPKANRHRPSPEKTTASPAIARLCAGDELPDGAGELEELTALALKKAREILELPLNQFSEDFGVILRAQANQVQTIFTAQLRADEGRFRKRQVDTMAKLIEVMDREEGKMLTLLN